MPELKQNCSNPFKQRNIMSDFIVKTGELIQPAIECAASSGGGRVVLLPGIHRSGTIYLKSNVELHIPAGAELHGGTRPEDYDELPAAEYGDYRPEKSPRALIAAAGAENIALTGGGTINGHGPAFYDTAVTEMEQFFYPKPPQERPRLLQFTRCRNVRFSDLLFLDSANWTIWLIENEDVNIHNLRIQGDPRMINNDGIHLFGGRRISISDCRISTGDDALVVRAGHAWNRMERICETRDLVVSNCILESASQGIRIGCTCDDLIHDCRFSNLIIRSRNVGIYLDNPKRYRTVACPGNPHEVDNISFDHISIESDTKPFAVEVDPEVTLKRIGKISFRAIEFTGRHPLTFTGSATTPLEEIVLSDVSGTILEGETALVHRYVRRLVCDRTEIRLGGSR